MKIVRNELCKTCPPQNKKGCYDSCVDIEITLDPARAYIIHEGKVYEVASPVCLKDVKGVDHWVQLTTNLSRFTEVTK